MSSALDRLRQQSEEDIAAQLAALLADQYDDLWDALSKKQPLDPPRDWWDKWQAALAAVLGLSLLDLVQTSAQTQINLVGIGADWDAILNGAQDWVSQYSFELVRDINATTEAALQQLLQQYYSGAIDYDTMLAMMETRFGPVRAASIAATESTRGIEAGIDLYQRELDGLGLETDRMWHAETDACPICAPYDGVLESEGWDDGEPPLHPNCRCVTEIIILPGSKHYREWRERMAKTYA